MPRSNRFYRYLSIVFDKDAGRRLKDDAEAALEKAGAGASVEFESAMKTGGQKGARALTTSLQREYRLRMARASQMLAEGAINERAFRREGEKAAREFNAGLSSGIRRLQASTGGLTTAQYAGLGSRFKTTGPGAAEAGVLAGLGRSVAGPLAALFTAQEGLRQIRNAIEASDELANSVRKLGGTAKLTGLDLTFLEGRAGAAKEEFKLSTVIANDLTTEVAKLASKAGDVTKTGDALRAFLDIGAARGLDASQTLQAVSQAILGIDEGTDKLFSKNPSTIYEEWANQIGRTAESLSDMEKAQALLDAAIKGGEVTRGSYAEWLVGVQGQASQAANEIRDLQAQIGKTFGPTKVLLLKIELAVVGALAAILERTPYDEGQLDWNAAVRRETGGTWDVRDRRPAGFSRSAPLDLSADAARMQAALNPERTSAELELLRERDQRIAEAAELAAKLRQQEVLKNITLLKEQSERLYGVRPNVVGPTAPDAGTLVGMVGVDTSGPTPLQQLGDDMMRVDAIAEDVAQNVAGVWQDAFAQMIADGGNVGAFFDGMWRGVVASAGAALAEIASKEAAKEFAHAIAMGAHALGFGAFGNLASAAAASGSASQHLAAALAWSALAGGASAAGGAARSRSPGSTHDAGLSTGRSTFDNGGKIGADVIIYVNPWDPKNPGMQSGVKQAFDFATERYGDAKITVKPYPRSQ